MGDLNAKVGSGEVPGVIKPYGLGVRNERGESFIEFCQEHELVVTNTLFKHHPRRLYTWTSPAHTPDHIVRNQIDYIAINSRFKNSIKSAQTYPGADINSDHNPVVVKMCYNLKKLRKTKIICRPDIRSIKHPDKRVKASNAINRWVEENFNTTASVEKVNHALVRTITDINETILGQTHHNKRQQWMEGEILDLMEERRLIKKFDPHAYNALNKLIRRKIRAARSKFYEDKCVRLEELNTKHDSFNLHKEIKEMAGLRKRTNRNTLVDDSGNVLLDIESKKSTWKLYVEEMFADATRRITVTPGNETGPPILRAEVVKALKRAKTGKSPGPDQIHVEILQLIEEHLVDAVTNFFNCIYATGIMPKDWLISTFITLPKKPTAKKCTEYRTISLMSQVLKLFLSIIHLFSLNVLVQKCRDLQTDVIICFVDYEKAFERVKHEVLMRKKSQ
ncbi:unnamed protein product [Pieris macdunnoughi]|uniref:Reverse transcriptase domain-containing protein n=1 Tax=Pieris macdunnoughi TaxID=345717 RepID=A0A821T6X8_9NEOP|nr:unnamed protein product [Pieris macdunnoughi]